MKIGHELRKIAEKVQKRYKTTERAVYHKSGLLDEAIGLCREAAQRGGLSVAIPKHMKKSPYFKYLREELETHKIFVDAYYGDPGEFFW